jgi:hypothetical protein
MTETCQSNNNNNNNMFNKLVLNVMYVIKFLEKCMTLKFSVLFNTLCRV